MNENPSLLLAGAHIARRNARYIVWFYLLNLIFAWWGAAAFGASAHRILDHSLYSDHLLHGMDLTVLGELFSDPRFGSPAAPGAASTRLAVLYFFITFLAMPGVWLGYSLDHRISREEFFRICGHNLWRFLRLLCLFVIVAGIVSGILFGVQSGVVNAATRSSNERLPLILWLAILAIIFLAATVIRAWFDLAQVDAVIRDQTAVRKSVSAGFHAAREGGAHLLGNYLAIALAAGAALVGGILLWHAIVPPASVLGAFLIGQLTLFLLLAMRFWQRATAAAFYVRHLSQAAISEPPPLAASAPLVR